MRKSDNLKKNSILLIPTGLKYLIKSLYYNSKLVPLKIMASVVLYV